MKRPNRDLLVLVKEESLNKDAIEFELEQLNKLLVNSETVDCLCVAHEIADLNRYKILNKSHHIRDVIKHKELKPFVFILNKN
jgi:hypothetical protein